MYNPHAKWIWLDPALYPQFQKTFCHASSGDKKDCSFVIVDFKKTYPFAKKAVRLTMDVCADTAFRLWINDRYIGSGPVSAGGDYDGRLRTPPQGDGSGGAVMPYTYTNHYDLTLDADSLTVFAKVQLSPSVMTQTSWGHGGFFVSGQVYFADGTSEEIVTDETYQARPDYTLSAVNQADYTRELPPYASAKETTCIWQVKPSPIELLEEEEIAPLSFEVQTIDAQEERTFTVLFDKIYSAYALLDIDTAGLCEITLKTFEKEEQFRYAEQIRTDRSLTHLVLRMTSIGGYTVTVKNCGDKPVQIRKASLIFIHYPAAQEGSFICSEDLLNRIYTVGKWTLKICRQSLELDSPTHQENLGCTGDYFVESLMNYYAFGDTKLTRFDLIRTADLLRMTEGRMFHTTYSLIWVQMLYDCYLYSGDRSLLEETEDALHILLERFASYLGENSVIENPPDYMFVDWIYEDGYSLHHPPKALGQTVLNAFYYKALCTAAEIENILSNPMAQTYAERAKALHEAFHTQFYDSEKQLYHSGLSTPVKASFWQPENSSKRYFSMHANTLAVLYGLCREEDAVRIIRRVIEDKTLITVQPYFMHFVLEAVWKTGLFGEYGLDQIRRWKSMLDVSEKALLEGWIQMPGYNYDLSHAWGGTPVYHLPSKLLGLRMLEPGYKKIALSPCLFGLESAQISVPTPYGMLSCRMDENGVDLTVPEGITVVREDMR